MIYGTVGGGFRVFKDRAEYEAWIVEMRAQRARAAKRRVFTVVAAFVAALVLAFAINAFAAPLPEPQIGRERGLREPDASPKRGVTLDQAKDACERNGGHWFKEDGGEQMPGHYIIGCLFAVPKSAK
jgi:hypothetical protein